VLEGLSVALDAKVAKADVVEVPALLCSALRALELELIARRLSRRSTT
jgi:hypothetical protein